MQYKSHHVWWVIAIMALIFLIFIPLSIALGVRYDYTLTTVAVGGALLGAISGMLGTFTVLRKESLMGDALSHAALPGIAIAFLIAGRQLGWLLVGAGIAGWIGAQGIRAITNTTRIKQDAAMGIVLTTFFALGLTFLSFIQQLPDASQAGLDQFIFGQAAAIVRRDVELIIIVGTFALLGILFFWKEFKLITFDREFAGANGYPVQLLDLLLGTLIVVAIVLGLQLAGVILMVGMLIAPAVAARQWTHHLGQMTILSMMFGAFSGASGAVISGIDTGLPTGPIIITVAFTLVFISLLFAPERGLLWTWWRQLQDKRRFAAINVLIDIYRHACQHDDPHYPAPEGYLRALRGPIAKTGLYYLHKAGLIRSVGKDKWALTDSGEAAAIHEDRNRLLWALYRQHSEALSLPSIREEREIDIRHCLPEDAVSQLEVLANELTDKQNLES